MRWHPADTRQLAGLRFEVGESGSMRIEAEQPTVHDDVADALMLAAGPYTQRGRTPARLTVALQDIAARRIPEAQLPGWAADVDAVTTGAGLVLPRRPWLQSVAGDQVTHPPGEGETWGQATAAAEGMRLDGTVLAARRQMAQAHQRRLERAQWTEPTTGRST